MVGEDRVIMSVKELWPVHAIRPPAPHREMNRIQCLKTTRRLRHDWTVAHHGRFRSKVRATHVIVED